ncbi:hypothetical protein S40285_08702 [Stachybotrys chlorohalonatus IBT 40285]|uniref:AA1-like domain-containing protein n=1 Tax=Stachybotrys chlorohalonatus (strain IBT 40285) TaxID=1283841 RepID=A0A084QYG1_STAC4|nr:hypothetical protein S40285_08702 [Stachybotrys chlorohalonata IBT 40285]
MHAIALFTGVFAAAAAAVPANRVQTRATTENIDIEDMYIRKYSHSNGTTSVSAVGFTLSGDENTDLDCQQMNPDFPIPSTVQTCGDSKYRFSLHPGQSNEYEFSLRIYHELGPAVGRWAQGNVPTYCRAGGNGPGDFLCSQVSPTTIVITSDPPPINP